MVLDPKVLDFGKLKKVNFVERKPAPHLIFNKKKNQI